MKINVTEEDIKNGIPNNCNSCAISQALRKKFNTDEVYTEVDGGDVILTINEKKYGVGYKYESDVLDFIDRFDNHLEYEYLGALDCAPPKPISFKIEEIN